MNFNRKIMAAIAAATIAVAAVPASAATLLQNGDGTLASAQAAEAAFLASLSPGSVITEDFETQSLVGPGDPAQTTMNTAVGTFEQTMVGQRGAGLYILNSTTSPFGGRFNTTAGGSQWLDSNDSKKVEWTLNFVKAVTAIGFYLTDVNDVTASMTATFTDGTDTTLSFGSPGGAAANGEVSYITAQFADDVTSIVFNVDTENDGWGIDDISVSAVPLPAAAWMLLAGVAGLGFAGRRKKA